MDEQLFFLLMAHTKFKKKSWQVKTTLTCCEYDGLLMKRLKLHYSDYVDESEETECCSLMSHPVWSWPGAAASIHNITQTTSWHDIYFSVQFHQIFHKMIIRVCQ